MNYLKSYKYYKVQSIQAQRYYKVQRLKRIIASHNSSKHTRATKIEHKSKDTILLHGTKLTAQTT
jgi:hypothetical protein